MSKKKMEIKWLSAPEEHNYPAARSYLSLLYDENTAKAYVKALRHISQSEYKAKDIFRASSLSLLGGVMRTLKRINRKLKQSKLCRHYSWCGIPVMGK